MRTISIFYVCAIIFISHNVFSSEDNSSTAPASTAYITKQNWISAQVDFYPDDLHVGDLVYGKISAANRSALPVELKLSRYIIGTEFGFSNISISAPNGKSLENYHTRIKPFRGKDMRPPQKYPYDPPRPKDLEKTWMPEEEIVFGPASYLYPSVDDFRSPFWSQINDMEDGKDLLLRIIVYSVPGTINVTKKIRVRPRSETEMRLIENWYKRLDMFEHDWPEKIEEATIEEWIAFEKQLTPGTFRNMIRMTRMLIETTQKENNVDITKSHDEMLEWMSGLHQLEAEGLKQRIIGIIQRHHELFYEKIDVNDLLIYSNAKPKSGGSIKPKSELSTFITQPGFSGISRYDVLAEVFPKEFSTGDHVYAAITLSNDNNDMEYRLRKYTNIPPGECLINPLIKQSPLGVELPSDLPASFRLKRLGMDVPKDIKFPDDPRATTTLKKGDKLVFGVNSRAAPSVSEFQEPFWKNLDHDGKVALLCCDAYLIPADVFVYQEVLVKPRPEAELKSIADWYEKVDMYENDWPKKLKAATAEEWKEFEEKLSEGTFRNFIHMTRDMVEIACIESFGKRADKFAEMQKWIAKLHPLEAEGLTKRAVEIVEHFPQKLNNEIDLEKIKQSFNVPKNETSDKAESTEK